MIIRQTAFCQADCLSQHHTISGSNSGSVFFGGKALLHVLKFCVELRLKFLNLGKTELSMKKSFWLDAVIATSFTFILMWGILQISEWKVFNAFDSIGKALSDVELTDYVFSQLRPQPELDTNIVVVNIGLLSRRQIAQQIEIISQFQPKVIGIDGFFHCKGLPYDTFYCPPLRDPIGNAMLAQAIKNAGNVVVVSKLLQSS